MRLEFGVDPWSSPRRGVGVGDPPLVGGGAFGAARPSTTLRVVPLPMGCPHGEDEEFESC
jgi:hypothetical protein